MEPIAVSVFASVLIVTQDRSKELKECLKGVLNAARPFPIEIIVILNGENQSLPEPDGLDLQGLPLRAPRCSNRTPAAARNYGLRFASGSYVCFLDDDVVVPGDYFEKAGSIFRANPSLRVLGGPDRTFEGAGLLEQAIGIALTSPIATGRTRLRHGGGSRSTIESAEERALILCNLWVKREIFSETGIQFDETFRRGEENVLLHEIGREGCRYDSGLFVYHRRKTAFWRFVRAVFQSGWFRAKGLIQYPGSASLEYVLPTFFVFYLIGFALGFAPASPLFLYGCVLVASALWLSGRAGRIGLAPFVIFYQALIPLAYGAGFAGGLLRGVVGRVVDMPGRAV